jgi:hypothetical protein
MALPSGVSRDGFVEGGGAGLAVTFWRGAGGGFGAAFGCGGGGLGAGVADFGGDLGAFGGSDLGAVGRSIWELRPTVGGLGAGFLSLSRSRVNFMSYS